MTAKDYTLSRDTADRLLTKFGAVAVIRRVTNTGTEWEPVQTPADYATYAARVEFTTKQIASGNVLATDERWLVAAGGLEIVPATPDFLVVGALVRSIVEAKPVSPAGVDVMYDCHVRV